MTIYAYLMLTNVPPAKWLAPILSHPQPIGRAVECEIVVPRCFMTVSRRHAQIRVERDAILIQDLNSSGGTRLNGVSLTAGRETQVIFGDRIALAELEMFVVSPESRILRQPPAETVTSITALPESSIHVVGCGTFDSMEGRRLQKLSPAEFQVICWVSRGLTTFEEIGKSLFRSPHTIRTQLNSIYQKLHVHSRGELLAWLTKNEISWAS